MDAAFDCTICGSAKARLCSTCRAAAYCSVECQQTDWLIHRQLCKKFSDAIKRRPSPNHRPTIHLPMNKEKPSLEWVNTKRDEYEADPYFHHKLDHLLDIAGSRGYIGRGLFQIRGNVLRGREENKDVIDVWYLDPDVEVQGIVTNNSLHNFVSPLRDSWGDKFWKGPLVITMREGNAFDPRHAKDVDLTAYRDALDYLGYYRDTSAAWLTVSLRKSISPSSSCPNAPGRAWAGV